MEWLKGWSSWDSQVWSEAECCWSLSLPLSAPTISSSWDKESTRGVDSEVPPLQRDSLVKWLKHRNIAPHLLCLEEETNLFRLKLIRDLGARTLELIEKEHVTCVSVAREEIWAYWNYRETSPGSRISCPQRSPPAPISRPILKRQNNTAPQPTEASNNSGGIAQFILRGSNNRKIWRSKSQEIRGIFYPNEDILSR